MNIDERYASPEFVAQFVCELMPAGTVEVLVAVPSNDSVVGVICGLMPRRVVFVNTGRQTAEVAAAVEAWFETRSSRPTFAPLSEPLSDEQLVTWVQRQLGHTDRSRVVFLATTGTSLHAARLTQLAVTTGVRVVHVAMRFDAAGRANLTDPWRALVEVAVPERVRELDLLRRARQLAAGGAPGAGARLLAEQQDRATLGQLGSATLAWLRGVEAREALRFRDAEKEFACVVRAASENTGAEWTALGDAARSCRDAVASLGTSPFDPVHLVAELLEHATRSRMAKAHNLAALLYYRCAEAIVGVALVRNHQIDPAIGASLQPGDASDQRAALYSALYGSGGRVPDGDRKLGLMDAAILLAALERWPPEADTSAPWRLAQLRRLSESRNRSLFAHGFAPVDEDEVDGWHELLLARGGLAELMGRLYHRAWSQARTQHQQLTLSADGTRATTR